MHAGQIALVEFPFADLSGTKFRPVVVLTRLPGPFDDWLVCMISSRTAQAQPGFDEVIGPGDPDFRTCGLKVASVIRCARVLVIEASLLPGAIGFVGADRLTRIRRNLAAWLSSD